MTSNHSQRNAYSPLRVVVYGAAPVRACIAQALGSRPARDAPRIDFVEVATAPALLHHVATGKVDLIVLDGEATPVGGLGLARQLKDEVLQCPPIVVVVGRVDDDWLARWARVDAVVSHPIDPVALNQAVVPLLRSRILT